MNNSPVASFIRPEELWRKLGLRGNQTVIHLGSGPGFYLIPAAKLVGDKGRAIGIDVREDMLEETEGRARREGVENTVTTIRANLENGAVKQVPKDSADWTLIANIIYQSDPVKILTEAKRITKPGGSIVLVEWAIVATPLGPPMEQRISEQQIRDMLPQLKLEVGSTFSPSPYHFGLILKEQS